MSSSVMLSVKTIQYILLKMWHLSCLHALLFIFIVLLISLVFRCKLYWVTFYFNVKKPHLGFYENYCMSMVQACIRGNFMFVFCQKAFWGQTLVFYIITAVAVSLFMEIRPWWQMREEYMEGTDLPQDQHSPMSLSLSVCVFISCSHSD